MRLVLTRFRNLAGLTLAVLALACSPSEEAALDIIVIGKPGALFETGARLSPAGQLVRAATAEGLVGFDEQGRVIPALADRWIVTGDGMSYIFRLREGTWLDGAPLTAESARSALRQAVASLRGTTLAQDLSGIEEIRAMAGRVLELRLAAPNPDLLQLLAQPELGLLRKGSGAGPMQLQRKGEVAQLQPIPPGKRGLPAVDGWEKTVHPLRLSAVAADKAVERFRNGEAGMVLGGRFEDFPLTARLGLSRGAVRLDPVIGLLGLVVTHSGGFLVAPENREAIAMAIDRDALGNAMGVSGWILSSRIVSPGTEGDLGTIGERWANLSLDQRQAEAARRVARWRGGGQEPVRLRIALPEGQGADLLFSRLFLDLKAAGMEAVRVNEADDADLRLLDLVARYPRASWFLGQLGCAAKRGLCSASADGLAAEARLATDPARRSALLAEAEAELTAANVYIPLGVPLRWSLVRGDVPGFSVNRWGVHPLMPLARRLP